MRTNSDEPLRLYMKSVSETEPSAVVKPVSRIKGLFRYRRVIFTSFCVGAINHLPCSGPPRSAQKHALLSKRGAHSQSIEPSRPTSAAVSQFPMTAQSSIRTGMGASRRGSYGRPVHGSQFQIWHECAGLATGALRHRLGPLKAAFAGNRPI